MNGRAFEGSYPGTAESYFLSHLKLREKLFIAGILLIAFCGCAHEVKPVSQASVRTVSACLDACPGASAVITANVQEKGKMCRCWAPNAFSYTFTYPDSAEAFDYVKQRWTVGMRAADQCRAKGFGWEPDETRESIVCVKPTIEEEDPPLPLRHTTLQKLQTELDEIIRQTRAEFESTHAPPHAMLNGRNRPPPRWLCLTPWESWRPRIWKKSA